MLGIWCNPESTKLQCGKGGGPSSSSRPCQAPRAGVCGRDVDWWEGVLVGLKRTMNDSRYGRDWWFGNKELFEFLDSYELVRQCFAAEWKALRNLREKLEAAGDMAACPDTSDCANKHCHKRPDGLKCDPLDPPFLPLIPPHQKRPLG